jgi:hypothetical protein
MAQAAVWQQHLAYLLPKCAAAAVAAAAAALMPAKLVCPHAGISICSLYTFVRCIDVKALLGLSCVLMLRHQGCSTFRRRSRIAS